MVAVPVAVGCMIPALLLLSHHAHSRLNDGLVGLGVGALLGLSGMSLFLTRSRNTLDD